MNKRKPKKNEKEKLNWGSYGYVQRCTTLVWHVQPKYLGIRAQVFHQTEEPEMPNFLPLWSQQIPRRWEEKHIWSQKKFNQSQYWFPWPYKIKEKDQNTDLMFDGDIADSNIIIAEKARNGTMTIRNSAGCSWIFSQHQFWVWEWQSCQLFCLNYCHANSKLPILW